MLVGVWLKKDNKFRGLSPIEYLFKKLAMLYPRRWEDQFKSNESMQDWAICWAEELAERGITFDEVKRGLARCIDLYDWPPSFPEFLKACRPALDYEVAFYEVVEQMKLRADGNDRWSNPAIYWAAVKLGGDMNTVYSNVKKRWQKALDEANENIATGVLPKAVPARKLALPAPQKSKNMSPVALAELEKMKAILGTKPKWQLELEEKGMKVDSSIPGLRHVSEYHEINRKIVNE